MENKNLNKFNRSFEGVKNFLRRVSYGCWHRKLFERHGIKPRSYDDFIRQLRFFIPEDKIRVSHHKKFSYFTLAGDFRRGSENYLHRAFLTKTILPEHCLQYVTLLQLIGQCGEPTTLLDLIASAPEATSLLGGEGDFLQSARRRLNTLADAGLLRKFSTGGKIFYEKISNPLDDLTADERAALSTALKFYRRYSLTAMFGYLLSKNIECDGGEEIFRFRNDNFTRILDDDFIFTILQALRDGKKLRLERSRKPPLTVIPLSIETDFLYSRQYLKALREIGGRLEPVRLRLDKIQSIKPSSPIDVKPPSARERLREVLLRVTFDGDSFVCALRTLDPLQIYPELWKLQPQAEILSEGLRERMKNDVREALKNYDDAV